MTTTELINSITCLCVEGVEVMSRCELAQAVLSEIEKFNLSNDYEYLPSMVYKCTCHPHDKVYYGCQCGGKK